MPEDPILSQLDRSIEMIDRLFEEKVARLEALIHSEEQKRTIASVQLQERIGTLDKLITELRIQHSDYVTRKYHDEQVTLIRDLVNSTEKKLDDRIDVIEHEQTVASTRNATYITVVGVVLVLVQIGLQVVLK